MIFLDSNIFIRFLTQPSQRDPNGERYRRAAHNLFTAVEAGTAEVTTSEVVLHEVCYVLGSRRHYHLSAPEIAALLIPLIRLPGFKFPPGEKALYLRAFEIYVANSKLEYSDSLIAARAERLGIPLATFDEALARLPFVTRWQPPADG